MKISRFSLILIGIAISACGQDYGTTQNPVVYTPTPTPTPVASRQAWIISPSDGTNQTFCITFSDGNPTALDTLNNTGEPIEKEDLKLQDGSIITAVCKIGNTGYDPSNCFGGFGPEFPSWSFFSFNGSSGAWEVPQTAVNNYGVHDGDLLAFMFTAYSSDGLFTPLRQPPAMTFHEICP